MNRMPKTRNARIIFYGISIISPIACSIAKAQSLEAGKCYDSATVGAAVKAEGHKMIMWGDRFGSNGVNAFYMNDNGYGYIVEGDKPKADAKNSTKWCVASTYKDIVLNYPDNPTPPRWVSGVKVANNINIPVAYQNGMRIIGGWQTYSKDASGREVLGKAAYVDISLNKTGGVTNIDGNGNPTTAFAMKNFGIITENFNYFAEKFK